jgi:hypothetical protein
MLRYINADSKKKYGYETQCLYVDVRSKVRGIGNLFKMGRKVSSLSGDGVVSLNGVRGSFVFRLLTLSQKAFSSALVRNSFASGWVSSRRL